MHLQVEIGVVGLDVKVHLTAGHIGHAEGWTCLGGPLSLQVMPRLCRSYAVVMPRLCPGYAQVMPRLCPGYAEVMPRLCPGYAQARCRYAYAALFWLVRTSCLGHV